MDLRRVIVYWWNPIPILEFVYNAHLDVVTVLLVALALLVAGQHWRGARTLIGVLLGLAALTKLYPLLFVFALARRRDWALFAGLALAAVALVLFGFSSTPLVALVLLPFVGAGFSMYAAATGTLVQVLAPARLRGRLVGLFAPLS